MICLLHSIRDRANKEKSPRSVGASGVKFLVFNDFEQKLEKNSTADFIEKQSKKFCTADVIEKKIEKKFHC